MQCYMVSFQIEGIAVTSGQRHPSWAHCPTKGSPCCTAGHQPAHRPSLRAGRKPLVFAHHHKVLDGLQAAAQGYICAHAAPGAALDGLLVRIDGRTSAAAKDAAIRAFQGSRACRLALLGIQAAGVRPLHRLSVPC